MWPVYPDSLLGQPVEVSTEFDRRFHSAFFDSRSSRGTHF
jgi:hypothetical protein